MLDQGSTRFDRFFTGRSTAWGMFHDRFGTLRRRFAVDIHGRWEGDRLTLSEWFSFDDGETEQRIWRIRRRGDGSYEGRAGDVIGLAEGRAAGDVVTWRYDFGLKIGARVLRVRFRDEMVFHGEQVMIGRTRISKYGIVLGELVMTFHRDPADAAAAEDPLALGQALNGG